MTDNSPCHFVAACTLVTRANGDVLMVKVGYRSGWEIPGGRMEMGESPYAAALRETVEETGIISRITQMTGVYTNLTRGIVIFAFLGEYVSGEPTPSHETPEVGWVVRDKVLSLIEEAPMLARVHDMLNFNGQIVFRSYTRDPYQDASVIQI